MLQQLVAVTTSSVLMPVSHVCLGVRFRIINDAMTKRLGASGVIRLSKQNVQVIVGTRAELVAKALTEVIAKALSQGTAPVQQQKRAAEPTKSKGQCDFIFGCAGRWSSVLP